MIPDKKQSIHEPMQVPALIRQVIAFTGVGVVAAFVHYGLLIGFVELAGWRPVPATLVGYVGGGVVSYWLNRALTYQSDRPHHEAGWRFAAVAAIGFCLTYGTMHILVDRWHVPYIPAQLATTGIVLVWSFVAHKLWTFAAR